MKGEVEAEYCLYHVSHRREIAYTQISVYHSWETGTKGYDYEICLRPYQRQYARATNKKSFNNLHSPKKC